MKISMVGPVYPYRGGIAQYTTFLAQALKKAEHQLQMISFRRQYPSILYPGASDKDPSTHPVKVDAEYLLDPLYPWTWWRAASAILRTQPNMVVIQWWTTFWAPGYAVLARRIRRATSVVFVIHNVFPHEGKPWDRWLARIALSQGHAFVVQAPHEQQKLLQLIPGARVCYCNLPTYARFGESMISREEARRELGLPMDRTIFLFFGIIRPYKGLKHLIEAMRLLDKHSHLVIAGEFWESLEAHLQRIAKLGCQDQVTIFNEYIPNERAHLLFSAADGLVAPYVGGTQSAAVGVSLGYGLPMIVTERIAAGIEAGTEGVQIVPAHDARALAAAMDNIVSGRTAIASVAADSGNWEHLVHLLEQLQFSSSAR